MPQFALHFHDLSYKFNSRMQNLHVLRPLVSDLCIHGHLIIKPNCFFDSGAPLSILSCTLGQSLQGSLRRINIDVNPLERYEHGQFRGTTPVTSLTRWEGFDCKLCEIDVSLIDAKNPAIKSGPLSLMVKWVQQPRNNIFGDKYLILGMHFLEVNFGSIELHANAVGCRGAFIFP